MESVYARLGIRIRQLREQRGFNLSELARLMTVDRQMIHNWEAAKTRIQVADLYRLADVLGSSVPEVLGEGPTAVHEPSGGYGQREPYLAEIIKVVRELPPPEQEELLELARIKLRRQRTATAS